jgi:hypothetical protein
MIACLKFAFAAVLLCLPTSGFASLIQSPESDVTDGVSEPVRALQSASGDIDLGNLASDGAGGRQIVLRPEESSDVGRFWKFFPPHFQLPSVYPDPTPATPAQDSYYLVEHSPLILAIPQLAHFPVVAETDVSYSIQGNEITVNAILRSGSVVTATIYGPHEYLLAIAGLDAGEYRLRFNLTESVMESDQITRMSGFFDFSVHSVPEPGFAPILLSGVLFQIGFCRSRLWSMRRN